MNSSVNQGYKTEFRRKLLTEGSATEIMGNLYNDLEANLKMTQSSLEDSIAAFDFETVEEHYALLKEINQRILVFYEGAKKPKSRPEGARDSLTLEEKRQINEYVQSLSLGEFDTRVAVQNLAERGLKTTLRSIGSYLKYKGQKERLKIKKLNKQYKWEKY